MPKSENQKRKILYLMKILGEQTDEEHPLPAEGLLRELEKYGVHAERKSIYNDMEELSLFGLDVCLKKGPGGGYYLGDRIFELPELKILIDSVQASRFLTEKKSRKSIGQLGLFCSRYQSKDLRRQLYVSNRSKSGNERIYYTVDRLYEAIAENVQVSFRYFNYDFRKKKQYRRDGKRYRVSPYALVWDDERYYLLAYDAEDEKIKHYRVDRMEDIEVTGDARKGKEAFEAIPMERYTDTTFSMYGGEIQRVDIRFPEALTGVILDRFGSQTEIFPDENGELSVHPEVAVSPQFFGWLFAFRGQAVLTGPPAVRQELERYTEQFRQMLR